MKIKDLNGRRVLVAFSAGLDSTWTLYRALSETSALVYAHHVRFRAPYDRVGVEGSRHAVEERQVHRIREWCMEHARGFPLTTTGLDVTDLRAAGRDVGHAVLHASMAAMHYNFGPDDVILSGRNSTDGDGAMAGGFVEADRVRTMARDLIWWNRPGPRIEVLEPLPSRAQQVADLPADLVALTSSCRAPMVADDGDLIMCGRCYACMILGVVPVRAVPEPFAGRASADVPRAPQRDRRHAAFLGLAGKRLIGVASRPRPGPVVTRLSPAACSPKPKPLQTSVD